MPSVRVLEPSRPSFALSIFGLVPAATPTDVAMLKGAAGKIIQIRRVMISGIATAATQVIVALYKRTAANTGGTSSSATPSQMDNLDGSPAAVHTQYSANPATLGAGVIIRQRRVLFNTNALALDRCELLPTGNIQGIKNLRLNGANEWIALNFAGAAWPAGGVLDYEIEWTEQ